MITPERSTLFYLILDKNVFWNILIVFSKQLKKGEQSLCISAHNMPFENVNICFQDWHHPKVPLIPKAEQHSNLTKYPSGPRGTLLHLQNKSLVKKSPPLAGIWQAFRLHQIKFPFTIQSWFRFSFLCLNIQCFELRKQL